MFNLASEVGVSTYKTWVKGAHLLVDGDRTRRYTGLIPKVSPLAVASIALAQLKLDRTARQLPLDEPWNAKRAAEWDAQTVGEYVAHCGIRKGIGHDLFEMAVRGLFTGDLNDASFLHLLFLVRGHGSINTLFSIENGSQETMIEGGAGSIAQKVADELGDAIHLNAPVRSIAQRDDRVVVETDELVVSAPHAVSAIPPELLLEVAFDPALPDDRLTLYRNTIGGPETKTLVIYDEPFWRAGSPPRGPPAARPLRGGPGRGPPPPAPRRGPPPPGPGPPGPRLRAGPGGRAAEPMRSRKLSQ